jgi:hypothetical protein
MIDWRDAISRRRIARFSYDGFERIVMPTAYGLNRHTGNELVRAYQIAGGDATRSIPAWSLFNVANVVGATTTGEHFEEAPPGYRTMDVIFAQL